MFSFDQSRLDIVNISTRNAENATNTSVFFSESPKNPLNLKIMEQTTAIHVTIITIIQSYLPLINIVELEWLKSELIKQTKQNGKRQLLPIRNAGVL